MRRSSNVSLPAISHVNNQTKVFAAKNKLINDLTLAIQLVQKSFLDNEKNGQQQQLTNSDYCVHELCQQFDNLFGFGLRKAENGYWKLVVELSHRNVLNDLKKLLNVQTSFGLGRAWIYSALNDNLMESYLKCLLENKKLLLRFYLKDQTPFMDDNVVSILLTLVSGLENVEFKMFSDVPYLDFCCWPTHFNTKRQIVDTILNASPGAISNLSVDLTSINKKNDSISDSTKININASKSSMTNMVILKNTRRTSRATVSLLGTSPSTRKVISNNVSLDASTLDGDTLSTCGSESGRFTATNNTTSLSSPNSANNDLTNVLKNENQDYEKSIEIEKTTNNISNSTEEGKSLNRAHSTISIDYEKEINKLRQENDMNNRITVESKKRIAKPKLIQPNNDSNSESSRSDLIRSNTDHDLEARSFTISKSFDMRLNNLETTLKTIENATLNMDACFNEITSVYPSYDVISNESSKDAEDFGDGEINTLVAVEVNGLSVYDLKQDTDVAAESAFDEKEHVEVENEFDGSVDTVSVQSLKAEIQDDLKSTASIHSNLNSSDYLAKFEPGDSEVKQEIRIDNNTKLMIMIKIFEQGEEEKLVKYYHSTRGHSEGEIQHINLLISSFGVYILVKNKLSTPDVNAKGGTGSSEEINAYSKESFIHQKDIDYVEVSLEAQAVHLVCFNKRKSCWFTFACRNLTEHFIENLQIARQMNQSLKPSLLSVFREATQQKLSIKKFIAAEENITNADVELRNYSLVYWEDQISSQMCMVQKEGSLWFLNKSSSSAGVWKKAYFVLKNDILTKYRNSNDKQPLQVIQLNGEDFAGCRRNTNLSKPNTIELILSNADAIYLSAKTAEEASDWLQCFCKIISLGNNNDQSNSPFLPCCSIVTSTRCYFCHEDLNTGFYRLLECIKFEEINRITFDNENPYFCILHDDTDVKNKRYWYIYFMSELERNTFIARFKEAWAILFQVPLTVEVCESSETRKRCLRTIHLLHKEWTNSEEM